MRNLINSFLPSLFSAVILSGCNTFKGFGKDVKKGGEQIEKAAEKAKS